MLIAARGTLAIEKAEATKLTKPPSGKVIEGQVVKSGFSSNNSAVKFTSSNNNISTVNSNNSSSN